MATLKPQSRPQTAASNSHRFNVLSIGLEARRDNNRARVEEPPAAVERLVVNGNAAREKEPRRGYTIFVRRHSQELREARHGTDTHSDLSLLHSNVRFTVKSLIIVIHDLTLHSFDLSYLKSTIRNTFFHFRSDFGRTAKKTQRDTLTVQRFNRDCRRRAASASRLERFSPHRTADASASNLAPPLHASDCFALCLPCAPPHPPGSITREHQFNIITYAFFRRDRVRPIIYLYARPRRLSIIISGIKEGAHFERKKFYLISIQFALLEQ